MVTLVATASVIALAAVLILAAGIEVLRGTPRSRWLSFAGGVAITYVFLKLLPELTEAQQKMEEHHPSAGWVRGHLLFIVALAGAVVLFGIERAAKRTKRDRKRRGEEERSAAWVFWAHAVVMAAYVAFIGYLLFRHGRQDVRGVAVLGTVMALHFAGIAVALADDYRSLYTRFGRWILACAVGAGGALGFTTTLPELTFNLVLGTLAGAVVFSAIKEEIPPEQESRFWALTAGVLLTGVILGVAG